MFESCVYNKVRKIILIFVLNSPAENGFYFIFSPIDIEKYRTAF